MIVNRKQEIFLGLAIFVIFYWIVLFANNHTSGLYNNLFEVFFSAVPLSAGIVALANLFRWKKGETVRQGIFFGGLGLLCWGIAGVFWSYYNFHDAIAAPYPSLADLFYLPSMILFSIAAVYFSQASGSDLKFKNTRSKFFITIFISVISYYLLLTIVRDGKLFDSGDSFVKNFLDIAYPCIDFVGLILVIFISGLSFKYIVHKYKIALISIIFGLVLMFISDSLFSYLMVKGTYYSADICDLSFLLATTAFTFGLLGFCAENVKQAEHNIHIFEFLKYR